MRGLPHWGVLIALEVEGRVEVGVAHFPAPGAMYAAASGAGCERNGERIRCSEAGSLADATVQIGEIGAVVARDPSLFDVVVRSPAVLADRPSVDSREVVPDIVIDLDEHGRAVGIDLDHGSRIADLARFDAVALPVAADTIKDFE